MGAYIKGIGIVSPQKTFNTKTFLTETVEHTTNSLRCIEPYYPEFINPVLARRMSRTIKMGIAAAMVSLRDAKVEMPDAIITGTALGCWEDTEKFLVAMIENSEQLLTPTAFMQSTHNTVSSQIALLLKCMNYNFTYVNKGFSFESAVLDAMMMLGDSDAKNILVGAHDEMTEKYFNITKRVGFWKEEAVATSEVLRSTTNGSVSGEGAAFFVLGKEKGEDDYAQLRSLKMIFEPENEHHVEAKINELLSENGLTSADIDVVMYGKSGDVRYDKIYSHLEDALFKNSASVSFKPLCGEYQTSSSFALWEAAMILKTQAIPTAIQVNKQPKSEIKNVLIYNHFMNTYHTAFLLSQS